MFMKNCYPANFFDRVVEKFMTSHRSSVSSSTTDSEDVPFVVLTVPFYGRCSETFAKKLSGIIESKFAVKVRVSYCTFKVKSYFCLKCSTPLYLMSNVIALAAWMVHAPMTTSVIPLDTYLKDVTMNT